MDVFGVSCFFCFHNADRVPWVLCLISMIHSMMLHLYSQSCSLLMRRERKEWIVDGCLLCVFLLSSPPILSLVSVVFDFNDSLNGAAPVFPMLLPVDGKWNEKSELLMDVFCVSSFFCLHPSDWVSWVLCLISMIHSMILLLRLQCCWLFVWREMKGVACWWMSFVCLLLSSQLRSSFVSVVFDFNDSQNDFAPVSPILLSVDEKTIKKRVNCWWMSFACLLLSSQPRLSWVSVVFDFSDSFSDVIPVSPIWFAVDVERKKRVNCWWMSFVCLLLSWQLRLSSVSVVFDFNDSLNDVAPVSPILLSVNVKSKGEEWIVDESLLCVFFPLSSQLRSSFASVVFDFNTSLNDVAPVSPMLLSVDVMRIKQHIILDMQFIQYSLWLPHRLSSTRDDFDPNTSLNDSTPAEPIQLPDDNKTHLWVSFVCLLSFVFTPKREFG